MFAIRTLPEPPLRRSPANFASRADDFIDQLYGFAADCNAAGLVIDTAVDTVLAGSTATVWVSGTTYSIGQIAYSPANQYRPYLRITNGAGTTDPSADTTNWRPRFLPEYQLYLITATTVTMSAAGEYLMLNSGASEATLPASPAVGDSLRLFFVNGRVDNYLRRNGQLLMGKAEDMLINIPFWARRLRFYGGTFGWGVSR